MATPESFEREMSASVGEWLRLLGGALAGRDWRVEGDGAHIMFDGGGTLVMGWRVGEPRRIALLPRELPVLDGSEQPGRRQTDDARAL